MKAVDILAKCVEVNEKTGKAICFFYYFPHTKDCSVSVHLSGYEESPEKADITFNQYLSEETCERIDWVDGEPLYSDCNILEELNKLLFIKCSKCEAVLINGDCYYSTDEGNLCWDCYKNHLRAGGDEAPQMEEV